MQPVLYRRWAKWIAVPLLGAALLFGCDEAEHDDSEAPDDAALRAGPANDGKGDYIVQMKPGTDAAAVAAAVGVEPAHLYERAIVGFAGRMTKGQIIALEQHPQVLRIDPDGDFTSMDTIAQPLIDGVPWGIDRLDQHDAQFVLQIAG